MTDTPLITVFDLLKDLPVACSLSPTHDGIEITAVDPVQQAQIRQVLTAAALPFQWRFREVVGQQEA